MATVFETRLIGNIGKDATINTIENGVIAINFTVAHNRIWKDKKAGDSKTKTTWVACTIWKREGANMRVVDFLKKGALVDLLGTPYAKAYSNSDGTIRAELRLNVTQTNILRPAKSEEFATMAEFEDRNDDHSDGNLDGFTIDESDF